MHDFLTSLQSPHLYQCLKITQSIYKWWNWKWNPGPSDSRIVYLSTYRCLILYLIFEHTKISQECKRLKKKITDMFILPFLLDVKIILPIF